MTNAELIARIKAEIERRTKELDEQIVDIYDSKAVLRKDELQRLLSFISTLEESEKPMNLEEEIKRFVAKYGYERGEDILLIAIVARHFAQWGAEHAKIDVTDFCKPIDPGIAQCIADHSWEMLGEDEKPVPNDLEEAAGKSSTQYYQDAGYSPFPNVETAAHKSGFIAGAKWQAEQLLKSSPLPEDTVLFNKGVAEGRQLMMEELSDHIAAAYQLGLAANNPNIELKAELIHTTDTAQVDGKELLYVSDKSYKIGWRDCKEQMLKEAVEGEVVKDINNKLAVTAKNVNLDGFKFGDKVRVIVLPKEGEK